MVQDLLDTIHIRAHALLPRQSLQQIYQQERGIYGRLSSHRLPQGLDRFQGRSRTRRQQLPLLGPDISGLIDIAAYRIAVFRLQIILQKWDKVRDSFRLLRLHSLLFLRLTGRLPFPAGRFIFDRWVRSGLHSRKPPLLISLKANEP